MKNNRTTGINFTENIFTLVNLFKNISLDKYANSISILQNLYEFGDIVIDNDMKKKIVSLPNFLYTAKYLYQMIEKLSWKEEEEFARSIITDKRDPWLQLKKFKSYNLYLEQLQKEHKFFDKEQKIVFLGSGPLPISQILFAIEYGIDSIGIECVPEYVSTSKKVIEVFGLTKNISIIQGNHFSLPLKEEHKNLIIAYQAVPQNEIFFHLSKALSQNTKILHRINTKDFNDCYTLRDLISYYSRDVNNLSLFPFTEFNNSYLKIYTSSSFILYIKI